MSVNIDKKVEISALYNVYGAMLTKKQRDIVEMFYNLDMSLAEIAESYNISRQAVRDVIVRAGETLEKAEDELHLYDNVRKLSEIVTSVRKEGDVERLDEIINTLEEKYGIVSRS